MAELSTNVRYIKGIGETRAKALEKLGITTLRDLIGYFPRTYEDRTLTRPIRDLTEGENVCVRAMIAADPTAHRIPGGRPIVRTRAVDETGTLDVVFFNQEYRKNSLHRGEIYIFYGKVEGQRRHQMVNPLLEPEQDVACDPAGITGPPRLAAMPPCRGWHRSTRRISTTRRRQSGIAAMRRIASAGATSG